MEFFKIFGFFCEIGVRSGVRSPILEASESGVGVLTKNSKLQCLGINTICETEAFKFFNLRLWGNLAVFQCFYICEKHIVVFCCTTKEVFKTNYESCSSILFLVLKNNFEKLTIVKHVVEPLMYHIIDILEILPIIVLFPVGKLDYGNVCNFEYKTQTFLLIKIKKFISSVCALLFCVIILKPFYMD